jgi:hypothetical protein
MNHSQPTDEHKHETAANIARRCVWILRAILRDEETIEATKQFYIVAREEIEKSKERTNP